MNYLKINKELLQWLVEQQSPSDSKECLSFINNLVEYLKSKGFNVKTDKEFNIYAVKTKDNFKGYYPCFVAHTDTAQSLHNKIHLIEQNGVLIGWDGEKQVGAGFDDKIGICICLQLSEQFDNVKLFFPSNEEIGCIGSSQADLSFFNDVSFCAQPDRRGDSDFIYYTNGTQVVSDEFLEKCYDLLDQFKYNLTEGTFTDIGQLVNDGIGICCFNISCGYRYEHTCEEYLDIKASEKCLNFLYQLTILMSGERWVYNPYRNNDTDKIINLTHELLYELDKIPLPRRVRLLVNQLNILLYGGRTSYKEISSFSGWDDSLSYYNGWDHLEM